MVYAIYVLRGNDAITEQTFEQFNKAFATGKAQFARWNFGEIEYVPEYDDADVNTIIRLEVENPAVTSKTTDEEIHNMFTLLRGEEEWQYYKFHQDNELQRMEIKVIYPPIK